MSLYAETDAHAQETAAQINAQFPTLEAFQNEEWIDVARRGCSKGKGIELLKQQLSFKTIAGIGDSYNDYLYEDDVAELYISFLAGCGKTGSAVFGRFTGGGGCGYDADA